LNKKQIQHILNGIMRNIVSEEMTLKEFKGKSLIDDLQLDSVALMELAAEIEERFGIHLDEAPSLLELFDNYDKLLEYLQQNTVDNYVSGKENV
jgi:acyl carrier protein